jgi:cytochrome P450
MRVRPLEFLQSLRTHGEVVKIYVGPVPVYVLTSPEVVRRVLVEETHKVDQGRVFDKIRPVLGNGVATSEGAFHHRQRRLMQPAFHHNRIARYAEIFQEQAQALSEKWRPGQTVMVDHEMHEMTVSAVGKTLFRHELGHGAVEEVKRSLPTMMDGVTRRAFTPVEILNKLPTPANRRFAEACARLRNIIDEVIKGYRANLEDRGDLLSMLLLARDEDTGDGMTDLQVRDELVTLMVTGTTNTATSLSWLFHELGQHPEVEQKLHAEVDQVIAGRAATHDDLPSLDHTRRVVKEVLRRRGTVWVFMRRAKTDLDLAGNHIPAGAELFISPRTLLNDPTLWHDPDRFDPDRWLAENVKKLPRGVYIPFSEGRRKCPGDTFALAEMTLVVATIASRWRLRPVPGQMVREVAGASVRPNKLPMKVLPRTVA